MSDKPKHDVEQTRNLAESRSSAIDVLREQYKEQSNEYASLKQAVQSIYEGIASRTKYNYEQAKTNFDARYETTVSEPAGGWVVVTSKVRMPKEQRKSFTQRKLELDFKNRFHVEKGIIDLQENYREVDKHVQVGNTYPMFFSDILEQQSRRAAEKMRSGGSPTVFKPRELRAQNVYEKDTLQKINTLKDENGRSIKKGTIKEYTEGDQNFYEFLLTTTGKSRLNYQGVHYPNNPYTKIKLHRGHKADKIDHIIYSMKD